MQHKQEYYDQLITDVEKLIQGTDPQTDESVEDSVLSSDYNNKLLIEIREVLMEIKKNYQKSDKRVKRPFFITKEEMEQIECTEEPVSISKLVYRINSVVHHDNMRMLRATQITQWLTENDYLQDITSLGESINRTVTKKAEQIGIKRESVLREDGTSYDVNLYDKNAQYFILSRLNEIAL